MPTYHYRCKSCSYEFEEFQSITAEALKICPSCKNASLSRVIGGGAGLLFKGDGFYITDYKNVSKKSEKENEPKKEKTEKTEKKSKKDNSSGN